MAVIFGGVLFSCVTFVAICIVSANPADKEVEDMEQMAYLKEWTEKHVK